MRRGELLSLRWECVNLDRQTAFLPDTKNGDSRMVPLSRKAVAILQELQGLAGANNAHEGPVFQTTAMALRKGFKRALERAQQQYKEDCRAASKRPVRGFLEDVHFHDTRHEAASRLSEKLSNVLELSAVTGHKDLRMLKRYYPSACQRPGEKAGVAGPPGLWDKDCVLLGVVLVISPLDGSIHRP
jgi:integrase